MREHTIIKLRELLAEGVQWQEYDPGGSDPKAYKASNLGKDRKAGIYPDINRKGPKGRGAEKKSQVASGVSGSLADVVREIRHRLDMTQAELAKHAEVTRATIINIESGKGNPSFKTLKKIADHAKTYGLPDHAKRLLGA